MHSLLNWLQQVRNSSIEHYPFFAIGFSRRKEIDLPCFPLLGNKSRRQRSLGKTDLFLGGSTQLWSSASIYLHKCKVVSSKWQHFRRRDADKLAQVLSLQMMTIISWTREATGTLRKLLKTVRATKGQLWHRLRVITIIFDHGDSSSFTTLFYNKISSSIHHLIPL